MPLSRISSTPIKCIQSSMLLREIKKLAAQFHHEIIQHQRHLHAHPELSFAEHQTVAYVKQQLDKIGIAWKPVANTGVLGVLQGSLASDEVVALRADMDALPIQEINKVEYASKY